MDSTSGNNLLKSRLGAVENIRKTYDLDKPGRIEDALKIMTEWILKQDHIIKKDFSKAYLELTLIVCKGSVEKAKKQIDRLCTMKTLVPRFFAKTNVKMELKEVWDVVWMVPLPTQTEDYDRIILFKVNNNNFRTENFIGFYQYMIMFSEYMKEHDYFNGLIVIKDYRDLNLMDAITRLNTADLQQFMTIISNGYGGRVKGVHLLTDSGAIDLLVKIFKQFFSVKLGNRIHVHKTLEDLHKVVPKELLPIEYGGNERSIDELNEEWIEEISSEENVEFIRMMNKACSDETKRHEGKFNEEYMGMPGSFRCLCVD